ARHDASDGHRLQERAPWCSPASCCSGPNRRGGERGRPV
ncbi:MAG: hypothetical protein AVDCRST_MAG12-2415, partial [uncultured Rubrobacteraceae bacterium]